MPEQIFNNMPNCVDIEEIFEAILDSTDGDYVIQTQILAAMKPAGWQTQKDCAEVKTMDSQTFEEFEVKRMEKPIKTG